MRAIALVALLAVGCGENSVAGSIDLDGSAGTGGQAGTGGGQGGTTGQAGAAGAGDAAARSCVITIGQISGTDDAATEVIRTIKPLSTSCSGTQQMVRAQVVDGALYNFPDIASWMLDNLSVVPLELAQPGTPPGMCEASIRWARVNGSCTDNLFVVLHVPAI